MHRCAVHTFAVLAGAVLAGACVVSAQSAAPAPSYGVAQMTGLLPDGSTTWTTQTLTQAAVERMTPANSCPVSVRARQSSAAFSRQVANRKPNEPGQMLHLDLTDSTSRQAVSATVTVRGYYGKAHRMDVFADQDRPNAARTMIVHFGGQGNDASIELWVPGLSGVKSIEVNSLTYGDGSTWMIDGKTSCSSIVDGLMLISGR